ncbi:MAG: flagellin [Limnochordia bacterium]|nr:flagellin [Limnochordia bacterium]
MNVFYLAGLRAVSAFRAAQVDYTRSMERISTGLRINRAADDPAGLAISEKMRAQIRGLRQASRNSQDAISLLNVADGALGETHAILHRLREIAVYSATGTLTETERRALQLEFEELVKAIDDIGGNTQFNTINLLDGGRSESNPMLIQVGANAGQTMDISLGDMRGEALMLKDQDGKIVSVLTPEDASKAIDIVDEAINKVSTQRAYIGAKTRRLEHTINNLENTAINLADAESRIRDADIAEEIMNMVKAQIRMQASLAMIAQANVSQQMILQLLWPK